MNGLLGGGNAYDDLLANAMIGAAPANVPPLPEGHTPNPAAPVIRYDQQPGLFGGLGFQPMSQEGLAGLGISDPLAMEFRTPRYDQPFTPFGMHTLDPFGYQAQFPSVGPQVGGPGPTPGGGGGGGVSSGHAGGLIPGVSRHYMDLISPVGQLRRWVAQGRNPATWNPRQFKQTRSGRWLDIDQLGGGG